MKHTQEDSDEGGQQDTNDTKEDTKEPLLLDEPSTIDTSQTTSGSIDTRTREKDSLSVDTVAIPDHKSDLNVPIGDSEDTSEHLVNGKKEKKKGRKAGKDKKETKEKQEANVNTGDSVLHDSNIEQQQEEQQQQQQQQQEQQAVPDRDLEAKLAQALEDNQQLEDKYNRLLGKLSSIRTSLGDRLKQDAEELAEARSTIETLQEQNSVLEEQTATLRAEASTISDDRDALTKNVTAIRDRLNVAQQNWTREREEFELSEAYLREEYETVKKSMQDWEVLAMEESSVKKALRERCDDLEEQLAASRDTCQILTSQRDKDYNVIENLRRALDQTQTARKAELRELVESTQFQIETLSNEKSDLQTRLHDHQIQLGNLHQQVAESSHFEAEVKEKTLLIGKLRHEAVILNEHLTKALRMLKRGNQQDTVDRYENSLPRGDAKKYEVLQLIASFLNWTDEQRESAGLARPGTAASSSTTPSASGSMRSPSISAFLRARTPSNSGLESPNENKEGLAELWTQFLDNQVKEDSLKPPT